jgi:hypothetical protein
LALYRETTLIWARQILFLALYRETTLIWARQILFLALYGVVYLPVNNHLPRVEFSSKQSSTLSNS